MHLSRRVVAVAAAVLTSVALATGPAWAGTPEEGNDDTATTTVQSEETEEAPTTEPEATEEVEAPPTTETTEPPVTTTAPPTTTEPEVPVDVELPVVEETTAPPETTTTTPPPPVGRQPVDVSFEKSCGVVTLKFVNPMPTTTGFRWNAVAGNTSTGAGARTGLVEVGANATETETIEFAEDEFDGTAAVTVSVAFGPDSDIQPRLDIYPVETDCGATPTTEPTPTTDPTATTPPEDEDDHDGRPDWWKHDHHAWWGWWRDHDRRDDDGDGDDEDGDDSVYYEDCAAVRDADAAPLFAWEDGYSDDLDGDDDGIACEWGSDGDSDDDNGDSGSSDDNDSSDSSGDDSSSSSGSDTVSVSDYTYGSSIPLPVGGVATGVGPK